LLFDRLSLRIAPGAKVGLVGRSGGGKTTVARLLLRFADVEAGEILVGGQSIARVPQAELRKVIAYVPQDPSMFHRSIADNIRVGRPAATDAEVRRAAQLAHAAEFIEALPAAYQTMVGDGCRWRRPAPARRSRGRFERCADSVLDEATSCSIPRARP
jgi:ATP-binding cassette subfamily B protein